eukprot:scaffold28.g7553.t1
MQPAPEPVGLEAVTVEKAADDFDDLPGKTIAEKVQAALATHNFCIEVSRTFVELNVAFCYYRIDEMASGPQARAGRQRTALVHEELRRLTVQRTVPYVFVGGKLVGGCDTTKALIAEGRLDALLGEAGAEAANGAAAGEVGGEGKFLIRTAAADADAPAVIGSLFEFPNTVDGRVIRLVALQIFFAALFISIFSHQERRPWKWVSVGMLVDFCLRFYVSCARWS